MPYYYVNEFTQELTGPVNLPEVPGMGVVVPGNAIVLPQVLPTAEPGYVWVWHNGLASQLIDLRYSTVYRKDNGAPQFWTQLGPLSDDLTTQQRPGEYYVWRSDNWELDTEAERAGKVAQVDNERDSRLREVVIRVAPLQYAYELGEASSEQLASLQAWKRYALKLTQIEQFAGYPLNIEWPSAPAKVVVLPTL